MDAKIFEHASQMPAITWHHLHANDAQIEIPAALEAQSVVDIDTDAQLAGADAFDNALDEAQKLWDSRFGDRPVLANVVDEQAEELGGLALSAYQKRADEIEASKSLWESFEQGMGKEVSEWLASQMGERRAIVAEKGESRTANIAVTAIDGALNIAALDLVAHEGAQLEVNIIVDSPAEGFGVTATTMRVFAGPDSRITIRRVQTLGDSWQDLDDMGLFVGDRADVEVHQTVLGAQKSYTGLAGDLRGASSSMDVFTHYLGHGTQALDFNYVLRHHGVKSFCNLYANGVLADTSSKSLRGTIDLIRGAKGAVGQEVDNVLLVDEGVSNKTVPNILCNEDDVMGNHGATIGHIKEDQKFYLSSRGLSADEAEDMFVTATLEEAWIQAANDATKKAVARLGNKLIDNFEEVYL